MYWGPLYDDDDVYSRYTHMLLCCVDKNMGKKESVQY